MSDINTVAASTVTSTENLDNSTTNSTADTHLDAAFDKLAQEWNGTSTDAPVEDSDKSQSDVSTSGERVQESQLEGNAEVVQQPAEQPSQSLDYQQLYQQTLKERELQQQNMNLLYDRLNDLSDRYQSLKQDTVKQPEMVKTETPAEVQELYELYPDIAKAVDKMIETRTKSVQKSVEDTTESKALQLQQAVQTLAQQNFINKVVAAHPDMPQIMQSRVLHSWVDGLDSIQKAGANHIMQYGTADDIIDLVSKYKSYKSGSTNTSTQPNGSLVEKVVQAMSVPSNRQEPAVINKTNEPISEQAAFDALAKDYERTFGWRK